MDKFKQINKVKDIYANGGNIIKYLKSLNKKDQNTIEDILISYDFQSGSYIKGFSENREYKDKYSTALAKVIERLGSFDSILEAGIGEATTLYSLLDKLTRIPPNIFGFDISWSRLKFAKKFLADFDFTDVTLFTTNLFEIPLLDNSIDIVYTSHSIEPNGGREEDAIRELYRIAGRYVILLEPSYEFADKVSRDRMKEHGYVTKLYATAKGLGYNIIEHRLFDYSLNPLNPTGIMIIEKKPSDFNRPNLRCPVSLTELNSYNGFLLYSKDSCLAYPIIENIPCLIKENSILATHLLTNYDEYKVKNNIFFK